MRKKRVRLLSQFTPKFPEWRQSALGGARRPSRRRKDAKTSRRTAENDAIHREMAPCCTPSLPNLGMAGLRQFDDATAQIIGAAITVHKALGPGLLESVYEKCLGYKLEKIGLTVRRQVLVPLQFEELLINDAYRIDLVVNDSVVIEVKACEQLSHIHFAQLLTYLRILDFRVGLLLNFNSVHLKDGIHRVVNNY
jgi:GxxExxY protein